MKKIKAGNDGVEQVPTLRIDPPDERPASFDKALTDALPQLRKFALKLTGRDEDRAYELLHDVAVRGLRTWKSYRPEAAGMATWLCWLMRSSAYKDRAAAARHNAVIRHGVRIVDELDDETARSAYVMPSQPANQENVVYLSQLLRGLQGIPSADVLFRVAQGEELHEIGGETGVSKQAVQQRVNRARKHLAARSRLVPGVDVAA